MCYQPSSTKCPLVSVCDIYNERNDIFTQAPYPFTRSNLRSILSEVMGRQDLANLIPEDEPNQQNKGDDSRKNDPNFRDPKN